MKFKPPWIDPEEKPLPKDGRRFLALLDNDCLQMVAFDPHCALHGFCSTWDGDRVGKIYAYMEIPEWKVKP